MLLQPNLKSISSQARRLSIPVQTSFETIASTSTKDNFMSEATPASSYRSVDPFSVHRVTMHKHKGDETEAVISRKPELMVPSDAISAIDDEDDDESEVGITVTAPSRRSSG